MTFNHTIDLTAVGKLLLNAWSAEYALNLTPLISDEDFIQSAAQWTIPQAYYVGYFGARAVFQASGIRLVNDEALANSLTILAHIGMYGNDTSLYTELQRYKKPIEANATTTLLSHAELCQKARRIAMYHEAYIRKLIGEDSYHAIVENLPAYMGFVAQREQMLDTLSNRLIS